MTKRLLSVIIVFLLVITLNLSCMAENGLVTVELKDEGMADDGGKILIDGKTVIIQEPGEYLITGSLTDGMLKIDCDDGKVTLHLNSVSIRNEDGPAIYVGSDLSRAVISLVEGSENVLSNGSQLVYEDDDEPNGVIFSRSDLTLGGSGVLRVTAGSMDGIVSKDDLRIESGEVFVDAARHGIRGKDAVEISGGTIDITAGKDGIKSTNEKDEEWGYVSITGGNIHIVCGDDPIQFVNYYRQENSQITIEMIR